MFTEVGMLEWTAQACLHNQTLRRPSPVGTAARLWEPLLGLVGLRRPCLEL